jgi:hypothetical protein
MVLVCIFCNAIAIVPLKAQDKRAAGGSHLKRYTISKATTHIVGPLRKDGSVDYIAALNRRFSRGVTPENNAAVLFWKAVGPKEIDSEYRDKYFQMLGIPPLSEKGDYFVDFDNTDGQLDKATERPWSQREFPVLAEWLAANEKPLALMVEASKRPRRYDPLCCGEGTLLTFVLSPAAWHYREVAWALCARAMLRLDEGKLEEAWENLLTCHRIARLVDQGPTTTGAYLARTLEGRTCAGDQALLQHANLTAIQAAKMRNDLDRLPAMSKMADKLDVAERFEYLDIVSYCSRQGLASLAGCEKMSGGKELANTIKSLIHHGAGTEVDWDIVLRMGNLWFDRIADACGKPTRAARRAALRKFAEDFQTLKKTAADAKSLDKLMLGNPRKALSERLGQVLMVIFFPDVTLTIQCEDRSIMRFELDKLGFALAAYRADHSAYPAKLADLTPRYIVEVHKDIFNDSELHYRLEGKGYLLYSVGINGKDDEAKSYREAHRGEEDWDDLVVRVPAPEQK